MAEFSSNDKRVELYYSNFACVKNSQFWLSTGDFLTFLHRIAFTLDVSLGSGFYNTRFPSEVDLSVFSILCHKIAFFLLSINDGRAVVNQD